MVGCIVWSTTVNASAQLAEDQHGPGVDGPQQGREDAIDQGAVDDPVGVVQPTARPRSPYDREGDGWGVREGLSPGGRSAADIAGAVRPPAWAVRYRLANQASDRRGGRVDEREVRELFFERLEHLSPEASMSCAILTM